MALQQPLYERIGRRSACAGRGRPRVDLTFCLPRRSGKFRKTTETIHRSAINLRYPAVSPNPGNARSLPSGRQKPEGRPIGTY